jgi:hypothetical protein
MTWFKVDDSFHSHPKALAASPAALGLWVVAGSWSGANLSDGFVPDHVLPRLLPDAASLAKELVAIGLWKRARGGYRFHDWGDFNPKRDDVEEERKAARERMRKLRNGRKAAGQTQDGSGEQPANVRGKFATPTRPVPKGRVGTGRSLGDSSATHANSGHPSPRCEQHEHVDDPPPCGPCADARRARTRWDLADSERRRNAPKCRRHRGQPADNCGLCRSEALASQEDS